jgi:hypothetical protein
MPETWWERKKLDRHVEEHYTYTSLADGFSQAAKWMSSDPIPFSQFFHLSGKYRGRGWNEEPIFRMYDARGLGITFPKYVRERLAVGGCNSVSKIACKNRSVGH